MDPTFHQDVRDSSPGGCLCIDLPTSIRAAGATTIYMLGAITDTEWKIDLLEVYHPGPPSDATGFSETSA